MDKELSVEDKELQLVEELVLTMRKLNESLALVTDAIYDVRASMNRIFHRINE